MKKNSKNKQQRKAAQKRASKRSVRLKSTQKEKAVRQENLRLARKAATEKFQQQMRDLFGEGK